MYLECMIITLQIKSYLYAISVRNSLLQKIDTAQLKSVPNWGDVIFRNDFFRNETRV